MARVILPSALRDREELEQLSRDTGLAVAVLLDLWRRGYEVKPVEGNRDEW